MLENDDIDIEKYIFHVADLLDKMELVGIELNNDPIIIKRNDPDSGLASYMLTNLMHIVRSIDFGKLPLIDMRKCWDSDTLAEDMNIWELFFEQPFFKGPQGLDATTPILSGFPSSSLRICMDFFTNEYLLNYWRKKYHQFIRFNQETQQHIDEVYCQIADQKLLGILCRGTDYQNLRPYGHPTQPSVEQIVKDAQMIYKRQKCSKLYLATEDAHIYQAFLNVFGADLIFTQKNLIYNYAKALYLPAVYKESSSNLIEINLDYITALAILSKCNCFLGGSTSGTCIVQLMTSGFEYSYIYNLGNYCLDDAVGMISGGHQRRC
ncbi:hypothetical protein LQZ18_15350 [Lachnospiraceae bacterium ZAX-1]